MDLYLKVIDKMMKLLCLRGNLFCTEASINLNCQHACLYCYY